MKMDESRLELLAIDCRQAWKQDTSKKFGQV